MKKLFRAEVIRTLSSQFDIAIHHIVGCANRFFDSNCFTVVYIYESRKNSENCFLLKMQFVERQHQGLDEDTDLRALENGFVSSHFSLSLFPSFQMAKYSPHFTTYRYRSPL